MQSIAMLTVREARGLPQAELTNRLDTEAGHWQTRVDAGLMTDQDWDAHKVFGECRGLVDLGELFELN